QTQGARAWALRAATSLARRQPGEAAELAHLVQTFTEGSRTKDLIAARAVLQESAVAPSI
ncbi:MAG: hypothetical protein ACREE0_03565, partial [Phenylobacterium sp.]